MSDLKPDFDAAWSFLRTATERIQLVALNPRKGGDIEGKLCLKKGGRVLKECRMQPRVWPYKPSVYELQNIGRSFPPNYLHQSWRDYLYRDTELEP